MQAHETGNSPNTGVRADLPPGSVRPLCLEQGQGYFAPTALYMAPALAAGKAGQTEDDIVANIA